MTPVSQAAEAGALFTAYHDRIRRYVAGLVRDPAEAEDLTQETFLRAHCQQETLRDPKAARGWLDRIATYVCAGITVRAGEGRTGGNDRLRATVPGLLAGQLPRRDSAV